MDRTNPHTIEFSGPAGPVGLEASAPATGRPVYLDNHSTTALDPRVLRAMLPWLTTHFGNAASASHPYGWEAEAAVAKARGQVAALVAPSLAPETPGRVVWTSGTTEAANLVLRGWALGPAQGRGHIVTTATEHPAVADTAAWLQSVGAATVTTLPIDATGQIDLAALDAALAAAPGRPTLVTVIGAHNEIGTIAPLAAIGARAQAAGALVHCDAAQLVGKAPFDAARAGLTFVSLGAHKFYGPKGVGALWIAPAYTEQLAPLMNGGGHEGGLRPGTLNVPGIVGLGEAAHLAALELETDHARIAALRDRLWAGICAAAPGARLNGPPLESHQRLAGNLHVDFTAFSGDPARKAADRAMAHALLATLVRAGVAVSAGSACASADNRPSATLRALGLTAAQAQGSIRFGLGRFTTRADIDRALTVLCAKLAGGDAELSKP